MAHYPWRGPPPAAPSGRAPPAAGGRTAARGGQQGSARARGTLHLYCHINTVSKHNIQVVYN